MAIAAVDDADARSARTGRARRAAARGNNARSDADARTVDHACPLAFALSFASSGHACTARDAACC